MTLSFAPDRIEMWPLARLQPYARNAKTHGADLLVLVLQLRAVAITGLANPEGPAGQRNANPVSRHRFLGHLAALRWPRHFFPRASLSRSACMLRSAYIRFSRRFSSSMAFI